MPKWWVLTHDLWTYFYWFSSLFTGSGRVPRTWRARARCSSSPPSTSTSPTSPWRGMTASCLSPPVAACTASTATTPLMCWGMVTYYITHVQYSTVLQHRCEYWLGQYCRVWAVRQTSRPAVQRIMNKDILCIQCLNRVSSLSYFWNLTTKIESRLNAA